MKTFNALDKVKMSLSWRQNHVYRYGITASKLMNDSLLKKKNKEQEQKGKSDTRTVRLFSLNLIITALSFNFPFFLVV